MNSISELRRILGTCKTLAVVGLSPQWHRPSFFAAKYMQGHGYRIIPVNPTYPEVLGEKSYASVADIPEPVDIVDPQGRLIYAGGIDSIPSSNPDDIKKAVNYVRQGLDEALAGKPLTAASTRPYGCSIKYKS